MPIGGSEGRTLLVPGVPVVASFGLRASLPLGVLLHFAGLWFFLHSSLLSGSEPVPPVASHQVRLLAPPAAALLVGDPAAAPDPEDRSRGSSLTPRPLERSPFVPTDLSTLLNALEPLPASFGAEQGIPEGIWDGFAFGRAEGVLGGLPGGVPGGRIGGLRKDADPVLPPPDEPPAPISMPRPRFPTEALRGGVRGRVVLRALITERGTVEVLRVLRSVPILDAEAVRVVESEWRFRPARRRGRPVPALSDLVVRFSLR